MLRRVLLGALAVSAVAGCANIDGDKEVDDIIDPGTGNAGENDAGNTTIDAGMMPPIAIDSGMNTGGDSGMNMNPPAPAPMPTPMPMPLPPPTGPGSCDEPFPLTFTDNKAESKKSTSGGSATDVPATCQNMDIREPISLPFDYTPVRGPEHVYSFKMPFKGKVAVDMKNPESGYKAAVYLLNECGKANTLKRVPPPPATATSYACDFRGALSWDVAADEEVFLVVDSGSGEFALAMLAGGPTSGAYTLNVTLRQEQEAGGKCDPAGAGDYCAEGLLCRKEPAPQDPSGNVNVCRAIECGDGYVEGDEECDDGKDAGNPDCTDACKFAARDTCEHANSSARLVFRSEGATRVARAFGTTLQNQPDNIDIEKTQDCSGGRNGGDHIYSFTLPEAEGPRRVAITLISAQTFDASLGLLDGVCEKVPAAASVIDCIDRSTKPTGSNPPVSARTESFPRVEADGLLTPGTYYVVVDSRSGSDRGSYELTVTTTAP